MTHSMERLKVLAWLLRERYCDAAQPGYDGRRLAIYPDWLSYSHMQELMYRGLAYQRHYKNMFNHTDFFITLTGEL